MIIPKYTRYDIPEKFIVPGQIPFKMANPGNRPYGGSVIIMDITLF